MSNLGASRNLLVNGHLKKLVRDMLAQGLDSESIANALDVDVELVEMVEPKLGTNNNPPQVEPAKDTLSQTEDRLRGLSEGAVNTLETLLDGAESEGVRFATARFVLEAANGALRAKAPVGGGLTVNQINLHITKATERYHEQLKAAGIVQEPAIDVGTNPAPAPTFPIQNPEAAS